MKVICIDAEAWPDESIKRWSHSIIKLGETYEVIDVDFDEGYIWYELSDDIDWVYWENCFARCSEIDETELIKQREQLCTL